MRMKERGYVLYVDEIDQQKFASIYSKSNPKTELLLCCNDDRYKTILTPGNVVKFDPPPRIIPDYVYKPREVLLELYDTEYPKERIANFGCAQVMFKTTALLTTDVADDSAIGESSKNRAVGYSLDFGRFIVNKGTSTPTEGYELKNDRLYTVWVGSYPKPLTYDRLDRYGTALYCSKIEECDFNVTLANKIREECPWKSSLPLFQNVITQRRFENDIQTDRIPQSVQSEAEDELEISSSITLLGLIVEESNEVLKIFCPSENRFYLLKSQPRFKVGDMCMFKFKDEIDGVYQDTDANHYPFVDVCLVTANLIQATLAVRLKQFSDAQMTSDWHFYGESVLGRIIIPQTMTFSPDARSVQVRAVYLYTPIKSCRWISVHTTEDIRNPIEEVDVCDTITRILDIGNSTPRTTNDNSDEQKELSNQIPDSLFMVDNTNDVEPLIVDLNTNDVLNQPIQSQPEVTLASLPEQPKFNDEVFTVRVDQRSAIRTIYEEESDDDDITNSIHDSQNDNVFQDDDVVENSPVVESSSVVENSLVVEQNKETLAVVDEVVPWQTELGVLQDRSAETFLSSESEEAFFLGGDNEAATAEPEIPNVVIDDVPCETIQPESDAQTSNAKTYSPDVVAHETRQNRSISVSSVSSGGELFVGCGDENDSFQLWNEENNEDREDEGESLWLSSGDASAHFESTNAIHEYGPLNEVDELTVDERRELYTRCFVEKSSESECNGSIDYSIQSDDELKLDQNQDQEIEESATPTQCRPLFGGSAPNYSPDIRPKSPDTKQNMIVHLPDEDEGGFTTDEDD
ncbi:hypothetical protein M3Y96_00650900 [Aphelenchoides besseyi]|nr:hypothetical protein M3Y96_00650900 [Aphelenchoides besseyi]